MTFPRRIVSAASFIALAALAGCQMVDSRPAPVAVQPTGVDGDWISTDGVAVSRFNGGAFETVATDTGNKLAEGSYRYADARTVEISVRSLIRQTVSNVNCAVAAPNQLNCTSADGNRFVLVRRIRVS
jgi:hypothetical protein